MRYKQIWMRIAIDIADSDAHAAFGLSVSVKRKSMQYGFLSKSTIGLIDPEMVRFAIVCNKKIRPPVPRQIKTHNAEASAGHCSDTRPLGYICEGAIAVVSEQSICGRLENLWVTIIWRALFPTTHRLWIKLNVVGYIEVEVSVSVVITKGCGCPPSLI